MTKITFEQLSLNETMQSIVDSLYFKHPTEIQTKAIPEILAGKSIIGQSQTGSGKTHAFLLPLLQELDEDVNEVQIVITAPTRELSMQLFEEIKSMAAIAHKEDVWQTRLIVGGLDRERMIKQLERKPKIIVGTPGRIFDMIESGALSIYTAKSFVIDEADLMLDLRFIEIIDQLLVRVKRDVQILVFTATIPPKLDHFIKKYLQHPKKIEIQNSIAPETMEHRLIEIKHQNIADKVLEITSLIQPYVALLFTNSKDAADELAAEMRARGVEVGLLHGGLTSRERKRMVKAIHDLKYQYIIATDLASRGIDIKGASHVINIHLPKEIEFYIHRVGRTARAGLEGTAISFYTEADIPLIQALEKQGVSFTYMDVKDGDFIEVKRYDQRALRKNTSTKEDKEAWKMVRKPKKVKPGYKKRMKKQQEQIKKRLLTEKNRRKKK